MAMDNEPMVTLGFDQFRWLRSEPRRTLPVPLLEHAVHTAFPGCTVTEIQPFADGLRNANFRLRLDSKSELFVLRLYEHDASLCQKEVDLMRLVGASVPVPEVIHAEPRGLDDCPSFMLMRYVEGITFRELKRGGDPDAIGQAAYSAGETLAAIGRILFPKSGWLAPGPVVTAPLLEGLDPMPRFVELCLSSPKLQLRMPAALRDRTQALVWSWASQLADLNGEAHLVHGDFNRRNLLVKSISGRWSVAAVLDWEFAISGSPLNDIGNFLCYERTSQPLVEPHFSTGYLQAGGTLPDGWRRLARLVDLTAICESLTRDQLPDTIIAELVELVHATIDNRDPQ
jgi:aminoglycoside phosphotransferase (APT) family kinase protein